jgi:hypothetical protein
LLAITVLLDAADLLVPSQSTRLSVLLDLLRELLPL